MDFLIGAVIFMAFITLLFAPSRRAQQQKVEAQRHKELMAKLEGQNQGRVKCPYCAELIMPEAKVCRFCGREIKSDEIARANNTPSKEYKPTSADQASDDFNKYKYKEALAECDEAIKLAPGDSKAHYLRGKTLVMMRRLDEAIEEYKKAVLLDPSNKEFTETLDKTINIKYQAGNTKADQGLRV